MENPFNGVQALQSFLAQLNSQNHSYDIIRINFLQGRYLLDDSFKFGCTHGAGTGKKFVFRPYRDQSVLFQAAKQIHTQNWKRLNTQSKIFYHDNISGDFNNLFINTERKIRSRHPNDNRFFLIDPAQDQLSPYDIRRSFSFERGFNPNWNPQSVQQMEIVIKQAFREPRLKVQSVTQESYARRFVFQTPSWRPFFEISPREESFLGPYRFHVENALEVLDHPGEWYHNKEQRRLYYYPESHENIENIKVFVPQQEMRHKPLIKIGDKNCYAQKVIFEGFQVKYSDWKLDQGYEGAQALSPPQFENQSLILSSGIQAFCDSCIIKNNFLKNLGGHGIELSGRKNLIQYNKIEHTAAHGIVVGDRHTERPLYAETPEQCPPHSPQLSVNGQNRILDNTISSIGEVSSEGVGILLFYSDRNQIAFNRLQNLPYSGISVGWGWTACSGVQFANQIFSNQILSPMQKLNDGAGIYVVSHQGETNSDNESKIFNNFIFFDERKMSQHHKRAIHSIYLDKRTSGFRVYRNYGNTLEQEGFQAIKINRVGENSVENINLFHPGTSLQHPVNSRIGPRF